ncbi:hypothetical protein D047_3943B, partial [Vibrio parahaemolyticus VPTS-2010_2]
NVRRS